MIDTDVKTCTLIATHNGPCNHTPFAQDVFPSPFCGQVVAR